MFAKNPVLLMLAVAGSLPARHTLAQEVRSSGICLAVETPTFAETNYSDEEIEIAFGAMALDGIDSAAFSDDVEIRQGDRRFATESAVYDRTENSFEFVGRVTYTDRTLRIFGEDASFDSDTGEARFGESGFEMPQRPARGSAAAIEVNDAEQSVALRDVRFTTCPIEAMAWELQADDVEFDLAGGTGTARGMKLRFRGVPLIYAPWLTIPLNDERKSGFLVPAISERDRTGLYIAVPYYFNLAPNYDLTVEPRYLSERGAQIANRFRYLLPRSTGTFGFEYLPNDSNAGIDRSYVNLQHLTRVGERLRIVTGIEEVSDDAYFEDMGNSLSVTSQTHLNRYVDIDYFGPRWSLLTRLQNYQTIDSLIADIDRPYERVPQLLFDGGWGGPTVRYNVATELVNFDRNVGTTGWRIDATQEISARLARSGMYLTPALAWRQTNYWVEEEATPQAEQRFSRGLPIASLDGGFVFERTTRRSGSVQTLEPRALYVNVPFEDQTMLPIFDTIMPDFNLIQLFRKYQFVGPDRVSDTDQLSLGVTTRLIDAENGQERLVATLGQTRYLSPQRVSLPEEMPNESSESDYVAEVSVNLRRAWNFGVGYQWNSETDSTARAETRFEYRPQGDRLFGFGYRYRRDTLEQGDVSLVWPVTQRWRIIGRYSYSLLEEEPLEQFLGLEFDACCWRLRLIGRQYVSRRTGEADTAISLQLELKGLSNDAPGPEELLDRGILGYRQMPGNIR
ncbi:MAG TPA: LPS assembly protein LptD [Gammaproteobacteria bacterium]|nr:LPS assembly protein LptD [Gammaproteobacteria bacterium]